ncbi:hypothetical protein [Streptomyces sp. NPDC048172]|uniref:hypothetical protein n=1 Tax=Streptomyces sp. NPDC048172 TaxID=3365505 RepID=UPI003713C719
MTATPAPDREAWETAALLLYEDEYVYVAVGPRAHSDWGHDLVAVLTRQTGDPRGWRTLDWDADDDSPFQPVTPSDACSRLTEISRRRAEGLLVALTDPWLNGKPTPEREAAARTLAARFGPDAAFHTNSTGHRSWSPFTACTLDVGVVAVSAEEIGAFWRLNPE